MPNPSITQKSIPVSKVWCKSENIIAKIKMYFTNLLCCCNKIDIIVLKLNITIKGLVCEIYNKLAKKTIKVIK